MVCVFELANRLRPRYLVLNSLVPRPFLLFPGKPGPLVHGRWRRLLGSQDLKLRYGATWALVTGVLAETVRLWQRPADFGCIWKWGIPSKHHHADNFSGISHDKYMNTLRLRRTWSEGDGNKKHINTDKQENETVFAGKIMDKPWPSTLGVPCFPDNIPKTQRIDEWSDAFRWLLWHWQGENAGNAGVLVKWQNGDGSKHIKTLVPCSHYSQNSCWMDVHSLQTYPKMAFILIGCEWFWFIPKSCEMGAVWQVSLTSDFDEELARKLLSQGLNVVIVARFGLSREWCFMKFQDVLMCFHVHMFKV